MWSLQLPTIKDGSMMMNQRHQEVEACLEAMERKNVIILNLCVRNA